MTPTGFCGRAALAIAHGQATTADGARSSGTASADARATSIGDARMEGLAVLQAELADTRLAVVRVGTNLNQAVRALHATGEAPVWLEHVVALCGRALAAVDAAATRVHRRPQVVPNVCDRGRRVGGLLRYLYGPGKKEEHTNPHLVAAWDGAGELADLEPTPTASGRRDFRHLVDLLELPVRAGRNPPRLPVWHCSVRAHPTDRTLTDSEWGHIAAEILNHVGIAAHGDEKAVRWVAVRHTDDHIHIVATLVRQDRRTVWLRYDKRLSQQGPPRRPWPG